MSQTQKDEVNMDEIYEQIGQFGKYQLYVLILVGFTASILSTTAYSFNFTAAKPDFR